MRREAGFTLLEMMVALVVLGLLLAGLAQAIRFGLGTYTRESAILAVTGRQEAVDRALRRLIELAHPGQAAGSARRLRLITTQPDSVATTQRRIDVTLFLAGHDLMLGWTPHLPGIALGPPPRPQAVVLARDITGLRIAYWWPKTIFGAPVWRSRGPAGGLPRLIRVQITGRDRHPWPALIAAPAMATAR